MECLPQQAFHFSLSSVRSSPITLEKSAQVFLSPHALWWVKPDLDSLRLGEKLCLLTGLEFHLLYMRTTNFKPTCPCFKSSYSGTWKLSKDKDTNLQNILKPAHTTNFVEHPTKSEYSLVQLYNSIVRIQILSPNLKVSDVCTKLLPIDWYFLFSRRSVQWFKKKNTFAILSPRRSTFTTYRALQK
jgi:hypothetical protein